MARPEREPGRELQKELLRLRTRYIETQDPRKRQAIRGEIFVADEALTLYKVIKEKRLEKKPKK